VPPICWLDITEAGVDARSRPFRRFTNLQKASSRSACVAVQRGQNGHEYLLTILVRTAELPMRVKISQDELSSTLLRARGILDRLRRDPIILDGGYGIDGSYVGAYNLPPGSYKSDGSWIDAAKVNSRIDGFLRDMALAGASFRGALFSDDAGMMVLEAIRANAPAGSIMQIWLDRDVLEFAYPWTWLYDKPFDPAYRQSVDTSMFWGHRWVIEQVGDWLESSIRPTRLITINAKSGLRVRVGLYNFPETEQHKKVFERRRTRLPVPMDLEFWEKDTLWEAYLPACDADIVYFFTHGHTALPLTTSDAVTGGIIEALKVLLITPSSDNDDETEHVRSVRNNLANMLERLASDGLMHEHHIKLAVGNLQLENLRLLKFAPGKASLVFLNMCESAQVFPSLTAGLVQAFLCKGALGVIGTEIPMIPQFAALFAELFIDALLSGEEVGPILLRLRRQFLDAKNPLGFAYTHFGGALLKLQTD